MIKKILVFMALLCIGGTILAQGYKVKVGEFDYSQYRRIEDRVFFLYELQERGFIVEAGDAVGKVDIYAEIQENRAVNDDDIDNYFAAVEQVNQDWQVFSPLERKTERVAYYVMNYQHLDSEVFDKIKLEFKKNVGYRNSENSTCETALPFCSDNGEYHFYPTYDSGSACGDDTHSSCSPPYNDCNYSTHEHHGSTYDGIYTAPNPSFYFMRVGQPGNINIYMEGIADDGDDLDIDFVCWGPFTDLGDICNLSCDNMVDASYDSENTENCYIDNAQTGDYYVLLITNYDNDPGEITFSNQGGGSTDCGVMEPGLETNSPICFGDVLLLNANDYSNAESYLWQGPDGWTSTEQNTYRLDATPEMSGTYTCTITKNGESAVSEIEVLVLELPLAGFETTTTVLCAGEVVSFTNTSMTYPIGGTHNVYTWNYGDGYSDSTDNATHVFEYPGVFTVTLNASAGGGDCQDMAMATIIVESLNYTDDYVTSCDSYEWHGQTYATTGTYQQHLTSDTDCGTIATLHLNITNDIHTDFEASSCEYYTWNGITYANTGDYDQTFTSSFGCDSIVTMHLAIKNKVMSEIYVEECPGYIWDGQMYTISGDFIKTFAAANGCDSVTTMHFTAKETPYTEIEVTECGSYNWDGVVYDRSGNYTHIYDAANECDSTVVMHLTINELPDANLTGDLWVATGLQDSTTLTASGGVSYLWSTGETTQSITVSPAIETLYYVIVTGENGCSKLIDFTVMNVTGVKENETNINIYPNPTNSTVNIEANGITEVRVCDIIGQVMLETRTNTDALQIDMGNFANGQYLIQVYTADGLATRKIVKM